MSILDALRAASRQIEFDQKREAYKKDIALWALDRIRTYMWSKQREICDALTKHKKVAVKSCHSTGKSYNTSGIISWWTDTRWDADAIVVSTAPTYEQVNKIIWEYLRNMHAKNNLPGKITLEDEWKTDEGRVVGFGRKPSNTNVHGFHGIHRAGGVLAVLDEACGIPQTLWTGVEAITTGREDRILAIGNPDDPNTEFGRIFRDEDNGWYKITISAFDTPNFTDEKYEIVPALLKAGWTREEAEKYCHTMLGALIQPDWVEDKKRSWGEGSPRYQSKVLGEFPSQGINQLFNSLTIAAGCDAEVQPLSEVRPVLGVDVARFGDDHTAVYINQNGKLRLLDSWSKASLTETADRVVQLGIDWGVSEIRIDGVGIGAGVWEMVANQSEDRWKTVGIIGNNRSPDLDKWGNYRAYMYDEFRRMMAAGEIDIDYADSTLRDELEGIQYKFNNRGAIQIESKDEMIKRGMKSPDFADAAAYAVAPLLVDPHHPLATFSENEEFSLTLEELLYEEEMSISPF